MFCYLIKDLHLHVFGALQVLLSCFIQISSILFTISFISGVFIVCFAQYVTNIVFCIIAHLVMWCLNVGLPLEIFISMANLFIYSLLQAL